VITRMTRNYFESNLHIFSSHFYTTLAKSDPSAVRSWTERKKIDIFVKRFIFIPSKC
jgi:Ulp1 family protease